MLQKNKIVLCVLCDEGHVYRNAQWASKAVPETSDFFYACLFSSLFFLLLVQTAAQSSNGFRWGLTVSSLASLYTFMFSATIPGRVQAFSSYPGVLMSGDDYYLLSSGLVSRGGGGDKDRGRWG